MILRGWRTYYALDDRKAVFERIDIHIRRHLRKLVWRGMEASHNSGTRAETQRTAKRTSMEIVRQWTRPMVERQRPSHAQSISQQRLSTNGALQSLVKGLTTESTT